MQATPSEAVLRALAVAGSVFVYRAIAYLAFGWAPVSWFDLPMGAFIGGYCCARWRFSAPNTPPR